MSSIVPPLLLPLNTSTEGSLEPEVPTLKDTQDEKEGEGSTLERFGI